MAILQNNKVIIIAEAGVNHNGNIEYAKKLIDVAAKAGVDYVKFQTFKAEKLVSKLAKKADYQKKNFNQSDNKQFNMLKNLELSEANHHLLIEYCKKKNIKFFSTAFDTDGLDFLNSLDMDFFKIPSGEITNYPYLKKISSFDKPIILSTGMSTMEEINDAIEILCSETITKDDIIVLHCNTEYPTPMNDVNLLAMYDIKRSLNLTNIGYSDHTLGIEIPIAAVSLGARVIEKHFTLDRNMNGPDHAASLEPYELIKMVKAIRNIELALNGDGLKKPSKSELKNISVARKSIHLNTNVKKGDIISENMLTTLRPGDGISPMKIPKLIGKKFNKTLNSLTKLKFEDFE
jgi:N-acetylneuraminate synthase